MKTLVDNETENFAKVIHEIRRPLAAIAMLADLAIKDISEQPSQKKDDKIKYYLVEILNQSKQCSNITKNMQSLSRNEGRDLKPVNINTIVDKALGDLQLSESHQMQEIKILRKTEDNLPKIHANGNSLHQLITNLIINAVEAMQASDKKILTLKSFQNGRGIILQISDTGSGISEDYKDYVFESYYSTKGNDGMGLGLSICKSIVDAHDGMISINSENGSGATFKVFLPCSANK